MSANNAQTFYAASAGDEAAKVGSNVGTRYPQMGDDAAVEALRMIISDWRCRNVFTDEGCARVTLAAIRAGQVPGSHESLTAV